MVSSNELDQGNQAIFSFVPFQCDDIVTLSDQRRISESPSLVFFQVLFNSVKKKSVFFLLACADYLNQLKARLKPFS